MTKSFRIFLLSAALLPLAGCFFRSHTVEVRMSTAPLQEASKQQLIQQMDAYALQTKTLNATVDISPSVGGAKKGKVTEFTDVRGYILVREPQMLRMIGLFPVVRNRAFDMVSDGENFRLSLPTKNKFIVGRNDVTYPSQSGLESLRPQDIFNALLLKPADPASEIAVLESDTQQLVDPNSHMTVLEPNYILTIFTHDQDGEWRLSRKVYFSREDLQPARQVTFDRNGNRVTDARYRKYKNYDGVLFPSEIQIDEVQQEYSIVLAVVSVKFNTTLTDSQFELPQPPGSQLVRLDVQPGQPAPANPPSPGQGPKAGRRP